MGRHRFSAGAVAVAVDAEMDSAVAAAAAAAAATKGRGTRSSGSVCLADGHGSQSFGVGQPVQPASEQQLCPPNPNLRSL